MSRIKRLVFRLADSLNWSRQPSEGDSCRKFSPTAISKSLGIDSMPTGHVGPPVQFGGWVDSGLRCAPRKAACDAPTSGERDSACLGHHSPWPGNCPDRPLRTSPRFATSTVLPKSPAAAERFMSCALAPHQPWAATQGRLGVIIGCQRNSDGQVKISPARIPRRQVGERSGIGAGRSPFLSS
jgi:hypothetical protein